MPPTTMKGSRRISQFESAITNRVGRGSSALRPANIEAKVGMTFHRMTVMTMPAIPITETGYTIAPLTWAFSLTFFSM
jgi:hypothetical protein